MAVENQKCCLCGVDLSDENAYKAHEKLGGHSPYCLRCQPKVYEVRATAVGFKLAMFLCCLEFNMPYIPGLFEEAKKIRKGKSSMNPWAAYIVALAKNGHHKDKMSSFADGFTDIKKAFDGDTEAWHVDDDEMTQEERAELKANWGSGPEEAPYSMEEIMYLQARFEALAEGRPYMGQQTKMTIEQICEYHLLAKRAVNKGEYENAKRINSMIKELMESEQLRKKDELPQDITRLDDIVTAIEKAGLHIMDYEELCKELATHALHPPYPYTRDAADQMIMMIRNATAWNEGVAEVASLPPQFRIEDRLGEFAEEPDEQERKIYSELGLSRMDGK